MPTLGLIQGGTYADRATAITRHTDLIREAAAGGASIICLQELFTTPYFCTCEDPALFDMAEPIPGPTTAEFEPLARELDVVLVLPLFERRAPGVFHNSAAIIDPRRGFLGTYRKTHIPEDPGFHEKFYFTPGDLGYRVWDTAHGRIGVLICWDQWYPEAARLTAMQGADVLFYPTAIGWLPDEKEELGRAQHTAWETVQRGHAVANGCFVAAVNRSGSHGGTEFWGQSFVANPYGEVIARAPIDGEQVLLVEADFEQNEEFRRIWPFFRDRRIDTYGDITRRWID